MNVLIGDDWRITTIPRNYVIQQRVQIQESHLTKGKTSRAGEYRWEDRGYYSSFQRAADAIPDAVVMANPFAPIHLVLGQMELLRAAIREIGE